MQCVKCSCHVFKPFDDSFRSCTNCGTLVEIDFVPAMTFIPQKNIPAPKPEAKLLPHADIVEKYRDSITQRRNCPKPTSWLSLASLISTVEKIKITEGQLQRCYERMVANGA